MENQSEILSMWEDRIRAEIEAAAELDRPVLIDTLPAFLTGLAEALAEEFPRRFATEYTNIPEEHGGVRARTTTFEPQQLIREYCVLRDVIVEVLDAKVKLTVQDLRVIQQSIDRSVQDSVAAYFEVHRNFREQFVAGLGHDLRQPLNVIKMSAELLKDANASSSAELVRKIVRSTLRADKMIQDLLDTIAVHFGQKLQLHMGKYNISDIIQQIVDDLNPAERKRLRIVGDPLSGYWDESALTRAIQNLVGNAFKYGLEDSPVTIKISEEEGRLVLSVHNEGRGIPRTEHEALFRPFQRSKGALASGKRGWGIGLTLVRAIAQSHGGSVVVDEAETAGATFTLNIPIDARSMS